MTGPSIGLASCEFETERLTVGSWHSTKIEGSQHRELAGVIVELLTPAVTRSLPGEWSGDYSVDRARAWIAKRDDEGVTLLALERSSSRPIGLVMLFAESADPDQERSSASLRLEYLLGENSWGKGFASELVAGLIGWCRMRDVASIAGVVSDDNPASARVLTKNGFREAPDDAAGPGERLYRLNLAR
ncbi:MAG TPA: GNAT family N-acetyltransferase [Dehalococcoidia bacterium]